MAITLMYNENVQIRLTEAEAIESGYQIVEKVSIKDNAGNANTLVHARALSTNVSFVKGNVFDYSKLIGWMGERAKKANKYTLYDIFELQQLFFDIFYERRTYRTIKKEPAT